MGKALFIDPSPVSMDDVSNISLSRSEMDTPSHLGGVGLITVTIITCGGKLGAATVITVGTAITTVISVAE